MLTLTIDIPATHPNQPHVSLLDPNAGAKALYSYAGNLTRRMKGMRIACVLNL